MCGTYATSLRERWNALSEEAAPSSGVFGDVMPPNSLQRLP